MLEPGTLIDGRYEVRSRIGSGGMADVYCARDTQLGRQVAVKLLHPRFAEDEEFVERFRREASSAAALNHPNVVAVYDRGSWDGTYYIAMEYLEGRTLKALVRERGALPPAEAVDIVLQVLRAARFAHRRGVIHRDLKPHNVIVDDEGRAKVTDFGIARAGASDMTQTGSIMGTAQYLSPEQAQGQAVGATSDVYSIGVILYELLSGRVPFEGDSAVSIALQHVSAEPVPPSRIQPGVPPALDAIVLQALAKDPAHRFPDADAFIAALEQIRPSLSEPVHSTASFVPAAVPVVEDPLPPPEEERHWWWWLVALLLAAAAIVALILLLHHSRVTVPEVVGEDQTQASATLNGVGLHPASTTQADPEPAGRVLRESPDAGSRVNKGSTVTLTVSSGPAAVNVPDVSGLSVPAASQQLHRAGLRTRTRTQPSAAVASGSVISTSPAAGQSVPAGFLVTITASSGAPMLTVPSVLGDTQDSARSALQAQGFSVAVHPQPSTQTAGTVIAQSPPSGTRVAKGSLITLTSAGPEPQVAVPDLSGLGPYRAGQALQRAGLKAQIVQGPASDPSQVGHVVSEDPPAGTQVNKGSTVTVTIGQAQSTTTPAPSNPSGPPTGAT